MTTKAKMSGTLTVLFLLGCSPPSDKVDSKVNVRMPNGTIIRDVPVGTTKTELLRKLQKNGFDTDRMTHPSQPQISYPLEQTFHGYACTGECSGHEAGYRWAEENSIYDPDECGGKSLSFEEGCRAYAEEEGY